MWQARIIQRLFAGAAMAAAISASAFAAPISHTSDAFQGVKVNRGTVTHSKQDGGNILTLSDDFKSPDAPAPHWQIVDSKGNMHLLQRLMVKGVNGDRLNRTIAVPSYIHDIAKVQIWCSFAETLLGEANFASIIMLNNAHATSTTLTSSMFTGVKANTGSVTFNNAGGRRTLALSADFKIPDAPAPHWQLVDSQGNVYMLNLLVIKGDKFNRTVTIPSHVNDVAKVQIWCAYAEVLLGEASFETPVR